MSQPIQTDIRDILDLLSNENWIAADNLIDGLRAHIKENGKLVLNNESNPQIVFHSSEELDGWYNNLKKKNIEEEKGSDS